MIMDFLNFQHAIYSLVVLLWSQRSTDLFKEYNNEVDLTVRMNGDVETHGRY